MTAAIGWEAALAPIVKAAIDARAATPFDAKSRERFVEAEVARARRFPWWPLGVAAAGVVLPSSWVLIAAGVALWLFGVVKAGRRGDERAAELKSETARLEQQSRDEGEQMRDLLARADRGESVALSELLRRWMDARPPQIQGVSFELSEDRSSDGVSAYALYGTAVPRSAIPDGLPREGRGGRVVVDKRKAGDIDEDLTQLNAAAVASVAMALFGGATRRRLRVRQFLRPDDGGLPIEWVVLDAAVNETALVNACSANTTPETWIRALGGDVGRCKAKRYIQARTPVTDIAASARSTQPPVPRVGSGVSVSAPVSFGEPPTSRASRVPVPPAGLTVTSSDAVPTADSVRRGTFSEVARRYKDYPGDSSARFVAFQQYWATYAHMAPGQLRFYFKWRNAVRNGDAPRTDLSYVFVHVYELLHLIGANGADDAADKLERLWRFYRTTYPQLDGYLMSWIVDLLVNESRHDRAIAFIERALCEGATSHGQEDLLVVDRYWARGDYNTMPRAGVALLTGDSRLGENKFYSVHNDGPDGTGWVDRVYREALAVTDRVVTSLEARSPRELEIARNGLVELSRESFISAVYDFRRRTVVLGKVPRLAADSNTISRYRNAVRYAENFLRRERGFAAKLRGVEVAPPLAQALDAFLSEYVRKTKPRARVVIDLQRAADLARESDAVRARLLEGLEVQQSRQAEEPSTHHIGTSDAVSPAITSLPSQENVPKGLLTDVDAVRDALAGLSRTALAVLETMIICDWEAAAADPRLAAAAHGALVGPLIDEINARAADFVGDVLIVHEGDALIVQEDFRDEVFWVVKGTLDGFPSGNATSIPEISHDRDSSVDTKETTGAAMLDTEGFGPVELEVLAHLSATLAQDVSCAFRTDGLAEIARTNVTTATLLVDRVNEAALASSYGDIIIEQDGDQLRLIDDARPFVSSIVSRLTTATVLDDS